MRISDWSSDVCSSDLHHQHGDPAGLVEIGEQFHDLDRAFGIEVAGRLVGEQHVGMGDDRPRDRDTLLLPTRKLSRGMIRSEEHTSDLQSLMRISYAVFCLKKKNKMQLSRTTQAQNQK